MCDKLGIDDKTRFLVLYFDARMNIQQISKILNRSLSTLRDWEGRAQNGEDVRTPKEKGHRKRSITEETENKIAQAVKENPEGVSITKLAARFGLSKNSIGTILARKGFKYLRFDDTVVYAEEERMVRVDFCKKMISDEGKLIYRTFFSDEMGMQLNEAHKTRAWQIPTQKVKKNKITENVRLDCWGAISAQGATSLDIYKKSMSGDLYRQVIERHRAEMESLYPDGEFYFLHDSHSAHRLNEDWIKKEQRLDLIKLPRRSPDLNIIESLWAALKERVKCDAPANEKELRASLSKNWEILTNADRLQPFFEGLHSRYMACISTDGQKLPY